MRSYLPVLLFVAAFAPVPAQQPSGAAGTMQAAAAAGDWSGTERAARLELAKNKRDTLAWTYLGFAQGHQQQPALALQSFEEAARLSPSATFAHNNYGASLEANGKRVQAMAEYRRSLALDSQQPAALVNLARLLQTDNQRARLTEARTLLERAWSLAPDAEIASSLLLSSPCATRIAGTAPDEAVAAFGAFLEKNATVVPVRDQESVGRAMLRCGESREALSYFSALLEQNSSNITAVIGKADAQFALDQPVEAGKTLEIAVRDGLRTAVVYAALSNVYARTDHMDHAIDAMRLALQLEPNNEELLYRYGMLLLDARAPKAAELRLQQAIVRNHDSAILWFVLGLAQFDQTQPAAAQESFDRAIALRGKFAPALAYRGLCALDQTHYDEAESWYRKAIEADPSAADLHLLLAEAIEKHDPTQVGAIRAELAKGITLDPKLSPAYLALGRLDLKAGNPSAAVNSLQTALQLDETQRQAHFYLARAYRQLHEPEKSAAESQLFTEQEAAAQAQDRAAIQKRMRQLARTAF